MNLLALAVLLALAWYSFDAGMTFFAFLLVLAAVLMAYSTRREEEQAAAEGAGAYAASAAPGQPLVIESPASPRKGEVNLKVKKWKDRWGDHPNEYLFLHTGIALSNIFRSVLYVFGIEKDEKE